MKSHALNFDVEGLKVMFKDNLEPLGEHNICDHDCAISIKSYTWKNLPNSKNLEIVFH